MQTNAVNLNELQSTTEPQTVQTPAEKNAVEKHLRQVKRQLYKNLFSVYRGW